jgi:predicted nucleic acid-binding protein
VGRAAAALSGKWRRQHRARGITLQLSDTLIAASAYLAGAVLATGNVRDFPMPELTVEEWSSG